MFFVWCSLVYFFLRVKTVRPCPEESVVDLAGANQVLELFETREGTVLKGLQSKINLTKKLIELFHTLVRVPLTLELWQVFCDLVEVGAAVSRPPKL